MGVPTLWKWLSSHGLLEECSGEAAHEKVVACLHGSVLAVDLSGWMLQAIKQQNLAGLYDMTISQCLPIIIARVIPCPNCSALQTVSENANPVSRA